MPIFSLGTRYLEFGTAIGTTATRPLLPATAASFQPFFSLTPVATKPLFPLQQYVDRRCSRRHTRRQFWHFCRNPVISLSTEYSLGNCRNRFFSGNGKIKGKNCRNCHRPHRKLPSRFPRIAIFAGGRLSELPILPLTEMCCNVYSTHIYPMVF